MNPSSLFDPLVSGRLCLTLLHSIWQIALLAAIAWLIERLWRKQHVEWYYALHVGALVLGLAALPFTYSVVEMPGSTSNLTDVSDIDSGSRSIAGATAREPGPRVIESPSTGLPPQTAPVSSITGETAAVDWSAFWLRIAPWLAGLYVTGVALMAARLAKDWVRMERLRSRAVPVSEGPLVESLRKLSKAWSMPIAPLLAQADRIVVPKVIGVVRPTILLPASALTGLSTAELEMVLAHELAHVRRFDAWVNLLQKLAEVALFFNPALWYLGRRISALREYCSDELACREASASDREPRLRYAAALLKVVELAKPGAAPDGRLTALAASGRSPSELRRRIARLFGEPLPEPMRLSRGGLILMACAAMLVAWGPARWQASAVATDDTTVTEPAVAKSEKNFSFGSKVEILAVGTHHEQPQQWWDTQGKVVERAPFTWKESGKVSSGDKVWRRIVLRVHDLPKDAGVRWEIVGARASAGAEIGLPDEPNAKHLYGRYFGVADDQQFVDVRVGAAIGPWKKVADFHPAGPYAFGRQGKSLLSSGALDTADGTVLVISHNYFDPQFRIIAVDKQGSTHTSVVTGGSSAGQIYQTRPTFPGLRPDDIDHFEFQVRDYEWLEFENLPLNPTEATDTHANESDSQNP